MTDPVSGTTTQAPDAPDALDQVRAARRAADARHGLLFILSSPSGAGKSTLSRRILGDDPDFDFSISVTTRPPRPGEQDGVHYHFIPQDRFRAMAETGELLEHAEVFGNFYGTPIAPVRASLEAGRDMIFDIDWQGGAQIRDSALGESVVSVFILPPSIGELERRLRARGQDSEEVIRGRMDRAMDEIRRWRGYDYVLINDDLDRCEAEIRAILRAERMARARRPRLGDFVEALDQEFQGRLK